MNGDAEGIREAVSRYTNSRYEFRNPEPGFPSSDQSILWFMVSPTSTSGARTVAPLIWETTKGIVSVESIELGNTTDWVEECYGEKAVAKVRAMELDFSKPTIRDEFKKQFPRTDKRISDYEVVLADVSKRRGIPLRMSHDRYQRIVTFYAVAEINTRSLAFQEKIEKIKLSIDAIKEAISEIDKYEAERARSGR